MKHWPLSMISCQTAAYCFFLNQSLSYTSIDWLSYFGQTSFYMLICLMLSMPLISETINMYLVLQITEDLQTSVTHLWLSDILYFCANTVIIVNLIQKRKRYTSCLSGQHVCWLLSFCCFVLFWSSHRACMSVCLALVLFSHNLPVIFPACNFPRSSKAELTRPMTDRECF